jgi:hypothetical protein
MHARREFEPLPSTMLSCATPKHADNARFSSKPLPSGYRASPSRTSRMARCASGLTPSGFSFEASLMMSASRSPISRASSEIGFPGWYGAMART